MKDKLYAERIKIQNERASEKKGKRMVPSHTFFATHYRVNGGPWKGFRSGKSV